MIRGTLFVAALLAATVRVIAGSQAQGGTALSGTTLSGYVLTPEWLPVSGGTVSVQSPWTERIATIGPNGRFRFEAVTPGVYDVNVSVPNLMAHHVKVEVPSSGMLTLPPIRLSAPAYVHLKVLSPAGEPITWPRVLRESFTVNGSRIPDSQASGYLAKWMRTARSGSGRCLAGSQSSLRTCRPLRASVCATYGSPANRRASTRGP